MLFCRGKESAEGDSKIEQSEVKKDISSKGTYISHTKRLHNIHQSHGDRDTWIFLRMAGHTRDQCYLEVPAPSNKNTIVFYLYKQTNKQINKPEVKLNSKILLSSPQSTNSLNLNCKMDWTISSNNQF